MGNLIPKTHQNILNRREDEEQKTKESFICDICIEPVTLPNKRFKYNNICIHRFCTECIIKYIQFKLEDNVSTIQCPAITCSRSLEPLSCCPLFGEDVFNQWCDLLCEYVVLKVDRVYCSNKECSELILNECGEVNLKRCVCSYCHVPFCFGCKVSWHAGYSCEQSGQTRDENKVAFGNLCDTKGWKMCPKCRQCIDLVAGCSSVYAGFVHHTMLH